MCAKRENRNISRLLFCKDRRTKAEFAKSAAITRKIPHALYLLRIHEKFEETSTSIMLPGLNHPNAVALRLDVSSAVCTRIRLSSYSARSTLRSLSFDVTPPYCWQRVFLRQLNHPTGCCARPLPLYPPRSLRCVALLTQCTHPSPGLLPCRMHLTVASSHEDVYARFGSRRKQLEH